MLGFFALKFFLCQSFITNVFGEVYDTDIPRLIPTNGKFVPKVVEKYTGFELNQNFIVLDSRTWEKSSSETKNVPKIRRNIPSDYIVSDGIGAHKLNTTGVPWKRARRTCIEEGGHLAIIRSESEAKIIEKMMSESDSVKKFTSAWIGYHDLFEEDEWVTVMDEPLAHTKWARWSKAWRVNPDNREEIQHCGAMITNGGMLGLDDQDCNNSIPFICKISIK